MTLYRRGKVWWFEFLLNGIRVRQSSKLTNKELARKVESATRNAMALGAGGVQKVPQPMLFSRTAESYLLDREPHWSQKTRVIHANSLTHLKPHFGKLLVPDVKPEHVSRYQRARLKEGASPRSINIEIALLRLVLIKHKRWPAIEDEVKMLRERKDVGRALSPDEQVRLLAAAKASPSRSLYPAILLSMHTGLRLSELRLMRWRQIDLIGGGDFPDGLITVGKSKTEGGEGRIVPLSRTAQASMQEWRSQFPEAQPGHAVFPRESYGLIGKKGEFGGRVAPYKTFPDDPVGSWKSAWQQAKKAAGVECRWHDLRHGFVSAIGAGKATETTITALAGWMSPKMLERYSHVRNEAKRVAISALDGPSNRRRPPTKSPTLKPGSQSGTVASN